MVRTIDQARDIQRRRVAVGLRGYAKAVRRFFRRKHPENYQDMKSGLMVRWSVDRDDMVIDEE